MVASGTHVNSGCCFDYGNAETNNRDNGNGHMDAVYFGHLVVVRPVQRIGPVGPGGPGKRPVQRRQRQQSQQRGQQERVRHRPGQEQRHHDLRDQGRQRGFGRADHLVQRLPAHHERLHAHAPGGGDHPRSRRRQQQQLRRLLRGRDDSRYPTDAADINVQTNIVSVGYAAASGSGATGTIVACANSAKCVDDNNGSGTPGTKVQMWDCDCNTAAQNWTVNSNGTLTIARGCMDITGANSANGTLIELWTCNGGANQQWQGSERGAGEPRHR